MTTQQTDEMTEAAPQGHQTPISPVAVANESLALNGFYEQRVLVLANQYQLLMQELERERQVHVATVEELNRIKEERDIYYADLTSAQACINELRTAASMAGATTTISVDQESGDGA